MNWTEASIIRAISLQTFQRRCLMLVDNCNWTGHECDVLGVTNDLRIIDIEVKISRSDLKADAKKEKWWNRAVNWQFTQPWSSQHGAPAPDTRLLHPVKVWKHYYAMPEEIWRPDLMDSLASNASGVLLLREGDKRYRQPEVVVYCKRRANPNSKADRLTEKQVIDIARLQNLRMWDAYNKGGKL